MAAAAAVAESEPQTERRTSSRSAALSASGKMKVCQKLKLDQSFHIFVLLCVMTGALLVQSKSS